MNLRWSLKELYNSFDSEEFKNDFENLSNDIKKIDAWSKENLKSLENPSLKLETYINMENDFSKYMKLYHYSSLVLSTESSNSTALKNLERFEDLMTELTVSDFLFKKFLSELDNLDELIKNSVLLKEHEFYLKNQKSYGKYLLSEKEETIIAKLKTTGSSSWEKQREFLIGNLTADIEIDGVIKKVSFAELRNFAYDENGDLRKKAFETELKTYENYKDSVAFSLNGIKGETINICKLRGYESPLEMTLFDSRMDKKTLDAMFEAIKEYLPTLRKFFSKKAEMLGHTASLPYYDLFAPVGSVSMTFNYEEAKDFIVKNFSDFSESLGQFANKAFEKSWIDAEQREGKRGGAFCDNIHPIAESRILTNFAGSFSDVLTLAHELGHGYHGDCLMKETYLNSDYPMPIAETASTLCETILAKAALKTATKEEKIVILENDITNSTQVTVDILSRFLFEDTVFQKRTDGSLSAEELNEIMLECQKEAYGEALDPNFLHPFMWLNKPHYYSAEYNYYNFPYAFGLLFAKGLYSIYLKDGEKFVERYDYLLSQTGKLNLADVAKIVDIDITDKSFWMSSLKIIEEEINEFISLSLS